MRFRRVVAAVLGAWLSGAMVSTATAQLEGVCGNRYLVQAGTGTATYDPAIRDSVRVYTWDELFTKFKYPRAIKSSKDYPETIAPKSRLAPFESTLIAIEGFIECGGTGGRGGGISMELQESTDFSKGRKIIVGYPSFSCIYNTPNAAQIRDLDRRIEPWVASDDATGGCGYIDHWVKVIGYGYWTIGTDAKGNPVAIPNIFPVVDMVVYDRPGGSEVEPPQAPDPLEDRKIDLTVTAQSKNSQGKFVTTSLHQTEKDGAWWVTPGFFPNFSTQQGSGIDVHNQGNNPVAKNSAFGWRISLEPAAVNNRVSMLEAGTYRIGAGEPDSGTMRFLIQDYGLNVSCCTTGKVTVNDIQWDCLSTPAFHLMHLVSFDATFNGQSVTNGVPDNLASGRITYSAPPQVPCPSSGPTPTPSPSPSPNPSPEPSPQPSPEPSPQPSPQPSPNPSPSPSPRPSPITVVVPDSVRNEPLLIANGGTSTVTLSVFGTSAVTDAITLSATSGDPNVAVSLSPSSVPAAGGDVTVTVHVSANATPRDYRITVTASSGDDFAVSSFVVSLLCNPPMILGVDQPRGTAASAGDAVTLTVKPTGSAPFSYQWFTGTTGNDRFPVAGATSASLTTAATNGLTSYWVRVTNACGSADSATATINGRTR